MVELFLDGGTIMWPIALIGAGVLLLAVRVALNIHAGNLQREVVELPLQAILFWGAMGAMLGMIGTVVGWIGATHAIRIAGSVEPQIIWAGIAITLSTLTLGMVIFALAAVSWFILRQWSSRAAASA